MHRLVVALVTLLGLTGVAVVAAYAFVFAPGTDRAVRLVPAEAVAYVNVYLRPSAAQQMNLAALLGRFPGFADEASLDEKVDEIVQRLLSGSGVDYQGQLKPWLGDQVALAVLPGADGDLEATRPVVIAEVKDPEAAARAVPELVGGQNGAAFEPRTHAGVALQVAEAAAYAFVDQTLVIGPDAGPVEAVIDATSGGGGLAYRADFAAAMRSVPADHLASAFVDLAALGAVSGAEAAVDGVSTAAAALVAEPDGLVLTGTAPFAEEAAAPSNRATFALGSEPSSLTDWMPEDTVAELVVFGLRQTLEDIETVATDAPAGEEVTGALDTVRALAAFGFGIDLDADVLPLLDREVAVAFGGIDGKMPTGQLLLRPDDPEAATSAMERLAEAMSETGATVGTESVGAAVVTTVDLPDLGRFAYTIRDGIVVIGLGSEGVVAALEAHDSGRSLALSERYRSAFELAGTRSGNEGWVDLSALLEQLGDAAPTEGDARDMLDQLGTLAFTAPSREDRIDFHAVLTVDETRPD